MTVFSENVLQNLQFISATAIAASPILRPNIVTLPTFNLNTQ
jgi:hypothetical protein